MARTIFVLGGTSAIAVAWCRREARSGARFVLVGRDGERLAAVAAELRHDGASMATVVVRDLADMTGVEDAFAGLCATGGAPDIVLLAYGTLGDPRQAAADPDATRRILDVNFTSACLWLQMAARQMPQGGDRWIVALGSVAGDRGRPGNQVYGAAKAGLATFAEGLGQRLHGTGVRVLLVKPGPTVTPMTAGFNRSGPLWSSPERVALSMSRAMRWGRSVAYAPGWWRVVMALVRVLPGAVVRRLKV